MNGEAHNRLESGNIGVFRWTGLALDLKIIGIWIFLAVATQLIPMLSFSFAKIIFEIPALFVIPGYCLAAAVFPHNREISAVTRLFLSMGISIIITSVLIFFFGYSSFQITIFLVILSAILGLIAQYTRFRLGEPDRFSPVLEDIPFVRDYPVFFQEPLPPDLKLAFGWLVISIATIYLPVLNTSPLRFVFAIPLALFIPGYCFIAALFPHEESLDLLERIALSVGLSIAIVPMIGFGLNFTSAGIRLDPIVISLTLFTAAMIIAADFRRTSIAPEERYTIPYAEFVTALRRELSPGSTRAGRVVSIVLALAIIIAIVSILYLVTVPREWNRSSEFYLLGEGGNTSGFPDRIFPGHDYPIFIGVGNHEQRAVNYTVEVWATRTLFDTVTNTTSILQMDRDETFILPLADNETRTIPFNISAKESQSGFNRIEFLLFNETVPGPEVTGSDRIGASYRDLHLVVNIF